MEIILFLLLSSMYFFQCNLFLLLLACACIVNLFFLGGMAQYGSNVPFYSFLTAISLLFFPLCIFVTTFSVFLTISSYVRMQ